MRRVFLLFTFLLCTISISAQQDSIPQSTIDLLNSLTQEQKDVLAKGLAEIEQKYRDEQVTTICGVKFGSSKYVTQYILKSKFGEPLSSSEPLALYYKNVRYGGLSFDNAAFLFQSDGTTEYLHMAMFHALASTKSFAKKLQKAIVDKMKSKYTMMIEMKDSFGFPYYACGYSPLWKEENVKEAIEKYHSAIHISITEAPKKVVLLTGAKYCVSVIYGPYNFVKEEF